jgi:hypothetical protein
MKGAALVVFLVALGIAAGLYATGPKYKVYCHSGAKLKLAHPGGRELALCVSRQGSYYALLRRTNAWERVKYAVVGSKDTRG